MKKNLIYIIAGIVFTFLAASGCRSTKPITRVLAPKDTPVLVRAEDDTLRLIDAALDFVDNNRIDYQTFSAKIKVDVTDNNGKKPDLLAVVRMVKDSAIWVSLSATFLNVEVYRVLITPNRVVLMNKQDREVQYRTLDYLQEVTNLQFDFKTLQDILIGNPVYLSNELNSMKVQENTYLLTFVGEYFKHLLAISSKDGRLIQSKLDDVDLNKNRTASIYYGDYEMVGDKLFSMSRQIIIAEKNKLDLKMKYRQVEFNKELSVGLTVPASYTEK